LTFKHLKLQQANDSDGVGFEALHSVYRDYDAFLTSGAAPNGLVLNTTDSGEARLRSHGSVLAPRTALSLLSRASFRSAKYAEKFGCRAGTKACQSAPLGERDCLE